LRRKSGILVEIAPRKQGIMQSDLYQQIFVVLAKENKFANAKKIDKAK